MIYWNVCNVNKLAHFQSSIVCNIKLWIFLCFQQLQWFWGTWTVQVWTMTMFEFSRPFHHYRNNGEKSPKVESSSFFISTGLFPFKTVFCDCVTLIFSIFWETPKLVLFIWPQQSNYLKRSFKNFGRPLWIIGTWEKPLPFHTSGAICV